MKRLALAALVACSSSSSSSAPAVADPCVATKALVNVGDIGGLGMYLHAPPNVPAGASIVVALHGCTQRAADYEKAGWDDVADASGFVVVYPEQSTANNAARCFRWWDPDQNARDKGEAKAIVDMVARAKTDTGATGKVFVTGLSAGGGMAAALLAAYPDLFEAGAIMSGLPAGCATNATEGVSCAAGNVDRTAEQWKAAVPATATPPRVSIWQGTDDTVVSPSNEEQLLRQWTAVNGVAQTATSTETLGDATHAKYTDRVETWTIAHMAHGVAIDAAHGCGTSAAYVLDVGLCSTRYAASFFGLAPAPSAPGTPTADGGTASTPPAGSSSNCP